MADGDVAEMVEWEGPNNKTIKVTKEVFDALNTLFRGQGGFGAQHLYVLSLFHDNAEYLETLDPERISASRPKSELINAFSSFAVGVAAVIRAFAIARHSSQITETMLDHE
eukprot:gene7909-9395_t